MKYCIFLLRQYITNSKYEIEDLLKTNIVNVIQSSLKKNINDNSIIVSKTVINTLSIMNSMNTYGY